MPRYAWLVTLALTLVLLAACAAPPAAQVPAPTLAAPTTPATAIVPATAPIVAPPTTPATATTAPTTAPTQAPPPAPPTAAAKSAAPAVAADGRLASGRLPDGRWYLGSPDAPVTLTDYSDFLWTTCRAHVLGTEPNIKDEFIRSGKVKMVFNHILDFGNSARLSQAAECAGDQGQFWAMHDLLFEQQGRLFSGNPDATVLGLARDLQLDEAAFGQCLSSGKYADFVKKVDAEAKATGIRVRPTFVLGERRIQGALPWPQFQTALAEATK